MTTYTPNHKLEQLLEKLAISSARTSLISLIISLVALLVACTSVFYSHRDFVEDKGWQTEQIEELIKIRVELKKIKRNTSPPKSNS